MAKHGSLIPLKSLIFSFHATNTIIISFLPLYLRYKGLTGTEIGWVLAIGPFASILAQPFWGYLSDKYKTVKMMILICVIGLLISSTVFFQMNHLLTILLVGAVFYFFSTPVGALSDSLGQRIAKDLQISFGSIRMWGSIGFATSSLVIGEILNQIGVQYMIWPYLFFGMIALFVTLRLEDIKGSSEPIQIKDVKKLIQTKPFLIFLCFMMFITISHRANDSFIGLYITQLGGSERFIGIAWFIGVLSEAVVFATASYWYRKYHSLTFVVGAGLLYTLRWFIYASINDPLIVLGFQVLHGMTFGLFYIAAFDYMTRIIPEILQSTGHLLFYAVMFGVSGIIGSLVGGALIDHFHGSVLYTAMGCSALIGTICLLLYHILPYGKQ